jgi:glutamate/tyrosine decarboxylase-like PLP-dependent enzyme
MIIEDMYNGRFYPCETVVPTSEVYRKAVKACAELMEQLSQRLSKEDYELVKKLQAQAVIAQGEESESHFKYGFSAGLIVQHEAYEQVTGEK